MVDIHFMGLHNTDLHDAADSGGFADAIADVSNVAKLE